MSNAFKNVQFTGKGIEYFQIWVVNILLTIVTLGIYSAWATVRNKRYLYGHTSLDGHAFQFHATPMQILKGRLIAGAFFVAYILLSSFSPILSLCLALILLGSIPWLIVQNLKFKANMTSYRNVRFNFTGTKREAFLYFMLYPFLAAFTLYLAFPWVIKKQLEFSIGNRQYGNQSFSTSFNTGAIYQVFGLSVASFFLPLIIILFAVAASMGVENISQLFMLFIFLPPLMIAAYLVIFALSLLAMTVYGALMWKQIARSTSLPEVARFDSNLSILGMLAIVITNYFAIFFTLGLATPWTIIRSMRYLCSHTQYQLEPKIDDIVGEAMKAESALGTEASEFFDVNTGGII